MLLSICIPVYNTDIRPLATELHRQSQSFSSEVELLFIDDASDLTFKEKNRSVGTFCDYQELPQNIGRSKIRNAFLPFVKGKYILFLDGDSVVLIKDLDVKGANFTAKRGAAVHNIKLVWDDANLIEGRVENQSIYILTQYVKKTK